MFLRPEIQAYAERMELEMRRKDALGTFKNEESWDWLKAKLIEERKEVDECIEDGNDYKFFAEESLHEGIMLVLMRKYIVIRENK